MKRQLYAKPGNSPVNKFLRRQQDHTEKGEIETVFDWVVASKVCRNRCSEALNTINIQWWQDAAASVKSKGYFNRTLKLIANVARRSDVPDLATASLLVNTQAVRRLSECKNRYALRRYITPDDWLQVEDLARARYLAPCLRGWNSWERWGGTRGSRSLVPKDHSTISGQTSSSSSKIPFMEGINLLFWCFAWVVQVHTRMRKISHWNRI